GESYNTTFGLCGDEIRKTDGTPVLQGITNPTELAIYNSNTYYAVAADGLLFADGKNLSNSMTAYSGTAQTAATPRPLPIPMENFSYEVLTVTATADPLVLQFNKSLSTAQAELYPADSETPLAITSTIDHNWLKIASADLVEGTTYRLVVTGASGIYGAQLGETTEFTFTYTAPDAEDVPEEVTPVIHQSQTDASIRRHMSGADVLEKLTELQNTHHHNRDFYGNAILNRLSTDTNTSHWFRITAPTVSTYEEFDLAGNYWGSGDEAVIDLQIVDFADYVNYSRVMYAPYLSQAPENTFPFVTGITVFNKAGQPITTAGNEEITVRVTFNRDMDTTIPLMVRFGSAQPFGDYEIQGAFVDGRTWEGRYTLNTLIENGKQYFTIENGWSATEDLMLQRDVARFSFAIDTTAAQALIMQGHAEDTGIRLSWTQDDFDTLMGYNVYRSNAEDGYYTRLNSTVIPADTMGFFDETVEPGQIYYYNFTVVQTDLTESEPSGKISLMSKDTMAPNIYHSPVTTAMTGQNLVITATVTDNLTIAYADLYYRTPGETEWKLVRMN
ncbi:MAG: hypothetical protein II290_03050, partial [Oscillospiraceae bacterium]|nr:hypothetical protein [Oscillospiraceae bacterium]